MTGGALLGLILASMGWLFFLAGTAFNYQVLRRSLKAKAGEPVPSGLGFIPGVIGSISAFFSVPALEVPWPWLWIALPLVIDPYCVPGALMLLLRK
jgi:hypothetical protein